MPNASCTADSLHSSYWGGVSEVTANGVAISDFSIVSASGTDYSHSFVPPPVPEPEQIWLTLAGGLVGALAWRRQRRQAAG